MEDIKFNENNLDYFNSLFNKVEDLETILESIPIADKYIKGNGSMLCSYYDKPDIPTWNDYKILKGLEDAKIIFNRESLRSFYTVDTCWNNLNKSVNVEIKNNLETLKQSNIFIQDLYHKPLNTMYGYELKIVNQLLPPEMYDEIKILFNRNCILPIREEEIDGQKHYCFFKTTGDNYGVTKALGYMGIIYIFSTDKDFIKKSTVEGIFYKLLTDVEHQMPEEVNEDLITKIANLDYDLEKLKIERLKYIVKSSFNKLKSTSSKRINDFTMYANDYLERYKRTLNDIEEENKRLQNLTNKSDKIVTEILDILLKYQNKNIIINISDKNALNNFNGKINIMLRTSLFNYNEDILNKMLKNPDKYSIEKSSFFYTLLKNAFKDDSNYEIIFTTPIAIDITNNSTIIDGFRMAGISAKEATIASNRCMGGLPNPHLGYFNCWGQNGPELVKLLIKNKYEEYMMALIATAGNLNLSDTTVIDKFKNLVNNIGIANKSIKFIKNKKTNELLSKAEFLKEIVDNEND